MPAERPGRIAWVALASWQRIWLVAAELAILVLGHFDTPLPILAVLTIAWTGLLVIFHRSHGWRRVVAGVPLAWVLVMSLDSTHLHFGMLAFRTALVGTLAWCTIPAVLADLVAVRLLRFPRHGPVMIVASVALLGGVVKRLPAEAAAPAAGVPLELGPFVSELVAYPGLASEGLVPRFLVQDPERGDLYLGLRTLPGGPSRRGREVPAILHLAPGATEPRRIQLDNAEPIGLAFEPVRGELVAGLIRGPLQGPPRDDLPGREIVVFDRDGEIVRRQAIAGYSDAYRDVLVPSPDGLVQITGDGIYRYDRELTRREKLESPGPKPNLEDAKVGVGWAVTDAVVLDGAVVRSFAGPPIRGRVLGLPTLQVVALADGARLREAQLAWSGGFDLAARPDGRELVLLPHWVDRAALMILDEKLELRRRIELPDVSRGMAVDFARGRTAAAAYLSGQVWIHDLASGRLLATVDVGTGARTLEFEEATGDLLVPTMDALLRIAVEPLIEASRLRRPLRAARAATPDGSS